MREQSPNHSDPIPNAENWLLVSDPFERPKVYRHRLPVLKTEDSDVCVNGVYICVMDYPREHPILLQDIKGMCCPCPVVRGRYLVPTLRLIINGNPVEIGNAYPLLTEGKEEFLLLPNGFVHNAKLKDLNVLRNLGNETPFRLKIEKDQNPHYKEENAPSFRGWLDADGSQAIRQAIALYDYFRGTP